MNSPDRKFSDAPAVRGQMPLIVGVCGPSGSGKTYSALELATGVQQIYGGEIFGVDTETNRMLAYADRFKFRHVPFGAPYGPLDYLSVLQHCVMRKAGVIVVDSWTHEHEGEGGVLDLHEQEIERLSRGVEEKREANNIRAWIEPKRQRKRLLNFVLSIRTPLVVCFRAADKMDMKGKKEYGQYKRLGFMPLGDPNFIFEATLKCLLLPGADGVPTWQPEHLGEKAVCKLPAQFREVFKDATRRLSPEVGAELARWAIGDGQAIETLLARYDLVDDPAAMADLEQERATLWQKLKGPDKERLKVAADRARARLGQPAGSDATSSKPA